MQAITGAPRRCSPDYRRNRRSHARSSVSLLTSPLHKTTRRNFKIKMTTAALGVESFQVFEGEEGRLFQEWCASLLLLR